MMVGPRLLTDLLITTGLHRMARKAAKKKSPAEKQPAAASVPETPDPEMAAAAPAMMPQPGTMQNPIMQMDQMMQMMMGAAWYPL